MALFSGSITLETGFLERKNVEAAWEDHISVVLFDEFAGQLKEVRSGSADRGNLVVGVKLIADDVAGAQELADEIAHLITTVTVDPEDLDDPTDAASALRDRSNEPVDNVVVGTFEEIEGADEDASEE